MLKRAGQTVIVRVLGIFTVVWADLFYVFFLGASCILDSGRPPGRATYSQYVYLPLFNDNMHAAAFGVRSAEL